MTRRMGLLLVELAVACILLISAGLFWASYYIDTREFRSLFTETVSGAIGREVHLAGEVNLKLWPDILLEVEGVSVRESEEFGEGEFAYFDTIHINVAVLPLIAKIVDVESIFVDGLRLEIIADETGRLNIESILESVGGESAQPEKLGLEGWQFSLDDIEVVNTELLFKDRVADRKYRLTGINIRTGGFQANTPVPVTVGTTLSLVGEGVMSDITLKGMVSFDTSKGEAGLTDASLTASLYGDFLPDGVEPGELLARVDMDWERRAIALRGVQARFVGIRAEGEIASGDLRQGISAEGRITVRPFEPSGLMSRFAPEAPLKNVDGFKSSAFTSFLAINESGIRLHELVATLDDITIRGEVGLEGFQSPVFDYDLRGNTIDLDRYLPLFMTGTPFVWGDFGLPFFRKFKGKGTIRADGFKVMNTMVSNVRLTADAGDVIVIEAEAISEEQVALGGGMEVRLGALEDGTPTLTLVGHVDADSQKADFAFLQSDNVSIGGIGKISLQATIEKMVCAPEVRSIGVVDYLTAQVDLSLGEGETKIFGKSGEPTVLPYDSANLELQIVPIQGPEGYWSGKAAGGLKLSGGADVQGLAINVQGPFSLAYDAFHVLTPGVSLSAQTSLKVLPKNAQRVVASGKVAYDSKANKVEIVDVFLQALETTLTGWANVTSLDEQIKAAGRIAVTNANPKRVIELCLGRSYETDDDSALTDVSLDAHFEADDVGFTLSDVNGEIDGMPVSGHVVGTGFINPMLAFSLRGGKLDIDRYLPPSTEATLEEKRTGQYRKAPPVRLPLEFLGALRLNGGVVLKELKLAKIRARNVTGDIRADNGQIHVSRVVGNAYDGALTADWKGQIFKDYLTTHLLLHVEDMQAGPLTMDLGDRDYVRGLSDVDIDLKSKGTTDDDILKNLNGKLQARVTNGSFKFSGYPKEGSEAGTTRLSKQEAEKKAQRAKARTSFQKAVGNFTAVDGVFSVDKFRVEAPPMLQSYGEGGFSLPDNTIDLAIRNDFVGVPSVTIELQGRLTDPKVNVPTGKIVNDTVSNILSIPLKSIEFLRDLF